MKHRPFIRPPQIAKPANTSEDYCAELATEPDNETELLSIDAQKAYNTFYHDIKILRESKWVLTKEIADDYGKDETHHLVFALKFDQYDKKDKAYAIDKSYYDELRATVIDVLNANRMEINHHLRIAALEPALELAKNEIGLCPKKSPYLTKNQDRAAAIAEYLDSDIWKQDMFSEYKNHCIKFITETYMNVDETLSDAFLAYFNSESPFIKSYKEQLNYELSAYAYAAYEERKNNLLNIAKYSAKYTKPREEK